MKVPSPCSFCLLLRNEQCGEGCGEKGGFGDERTQVEEKENQVSHPEKKRSWNRDEGDRKRESLVGKNAQKQDGRIAYSPVFLPGESQGRGSLMGCRLWGRTELDTTEAT